MDDSSLNTVRDSSTWFAHDPQQYCSLYFSHCFGQTDGKSLHELERELERVKKDNEEWGVPPTPDVEKKGPGDEEEEDPADVLPDCMAYGVSE
jgi:hypothetical protein